MTHSLQEDRELAALAATGKLKLGEGELDDSFWDPPAPRIAPQALRRALELEREED